MVPKFLRIGVAHWNNVLHELTEEFGALCLLIHGNYWPTVAHDLTQPQPSRIELRQNRSEKSCERAGLIADEKRFTLRRKRVSGLPIFLQQFEADERVHYCAQTAFRRARFLAHLLDGFGAA